MKKICANPECKKLFEDKSYNQSKKYCSGSCKDFVNYKFEKVSFNDSETKKKKIRSTKLKNGMFYRKDLMTETILNG